MLKGGRRLRAPGDKEEEDQEVRRPERDSLHRGGRRLGDVIPLDYKRSHSGITDGFYHQVSQVMTVRTRRGNRAFILKSRGGGGGPWQEVMSGNGTW